MDMDLPYVLFQINMIGLIRQCKFRVMCAVRSRWVNVCVNRFLEQQLKAAASDRLSYHTG